MPVFKASMKITRQNLWLIIMYVVIVAMVLTLTIGNLSGSADSKYAAQSMKISFVDEDNSALSQALSRHLAQTHQVKPRANDPASLAEDLYYRDSDLVIRVPRGFGEDPAGNPLLMTEVPGSYTGVYLENQMEGYLSQIHLYEVAGFSLEEAISLANEAPAPEITVLQKQDGNRNLTGSFFQFVPYGAVCMLCFGIGNVLCAFMKTEIRKRTSASALTRRAMEWELLLAVGVFGLAVFGVLLIIGTVFCGSSLWGSDRLGLYLANLAAMILVSISLAYLISMNVKSQDSMSGIVNSVALGMSFFCGVFVPLDILGSGVKTVAHFLPFYWYEQANVMISTLPALTGSIQAQIWGCLGIQAAFALAFLTLGAFTHRKRYC